MAVKERGRPTVFTPDTKDLLLEYIEAGVSNIEACRIMGVQQQNFYLSLSRDPDFREKYERAKAAAVDALVDDGEAAAERAERAENGAQVAGLKVRADYKFRMASRLAPHRWGEKSNVTISTAISDDPVEMAKRVAFLEALNASEPGNAAEPDEDDGSSEFV